VGLAEGVAAADQRDGLGVVHAHAREDLADVRRTETGDRLAHEAMRVNLPGANTVNRGERMSKGTFDNT
jgi:hypothetical protein